MKPEFLNFSIWKSGFKNLGPSSLKITDFLSFLIIKIQDFSFFSFLFLIKNQNLFLFCILKMTDSILTLSIWVNRKFKISNCLFLARENCRAKKRLVTSDQLSPVSVKKIDIFTNLEISKRDRNTCRNWEDDDKN